MHIAVLTNIPEGLLEPSVKKDLEDAQNLIINALEKKHTVSSINVTKENSSRFEKNLKEMNIDIVFNAMDRIDEDIDFEPHVLEKLQQLNIPYTGATPEHIHTCDNKIKTKSKLIENNIVTPEFHVFELNERNEEKEYNFPLIVKPSQNHNSVGITSNNVVSTKENLHNKVNELKESFNQSIFAEQFIPGKDYEITVIGNKLTQVLPVTELSYKNASDDPNRIFCYNSKWNQESDSWGDYIIARSLKQDTEQEMKRTALKIFQTFKLHDFARIDFRVSRNNKPYVLEVTINPCLSSIGSTKRAAEAAGMSYDQLVNRILKHACERQNIQWN